MKTKNAFFKTDELRILWPFYLNTLVVNTFLFYEFYYILMFKDVGFSLAQIGLLFTSMSLAVFLFEIPTGVIADRVSRKTSVLIGVFLSIPLSLTLYFVHSFTVVLFVFFGFGICQTFVSGASEAWVVDLLNGKGRPELVHEYYMKMQSMASLSGLLAGIIGTLFVGKYGLNVIWLMDGIASAVTGFLYLFVEEKFSRNLETGKGRLGAVWKHSKNSLSYVLRHPVVAYIFGGTVFLVLAGSMGHEITWFPLLQNQGLKKSLFGLLASGSYVLSIFLPYLTKKMVEKAGGYKKYLIMSIMLRIITVFLLFFFNNMLATIVLYYLMLTSFDLFGPVQSVFFQKHIPSGKRATIGSMKNMLRSIVLLVSMPLVGLLADKIGSRLTIVLSVIPLSIALLFYFKISEGK